MKIWLYFIIFIFVFVTVIFRMRRLVRGSIAILIVIFAISIYQITTYFKINIVQNAAKKLSTKNESIKNEPTKSIIQTVWMHDPETAQIRKMPTPLLNFFKQIKYKTKKDKTSSESTSPWDFDEHDKKQITKQYMIWSTWLESHSSVGLPYVKKFLRIIEDHQMKAPLFCKAASELYVLVDKLMDRLWELDFFGREEFIEFMDKPKFIKCCKILQQSTGMSWLELKNDKTPGKLYHDEGAMWVCDEFLRIKSSENE